MADARGLTDLPLEIYNRAMPQVGVPDAQLTAIIRNLSSTSRCLHSLLKQELVDRKFVKELWRAVINDKRESVVKQSKKRPDLFLRAVTQSIPNPFVTESKFTFQKFDLEGKNLFTAVVRLKQVEMFKTLLLCCKPFEQNVPLKAVLQRTAREALAEWVYYDTIIKPNTDPNADEEILILPNYLALAQSLFDVLWVETFPNGVPGQSDIPEEEGISVKVALSEQSESAITSLHNILVPKTAVKLDQHIDVELFLLALYTVSRNHTHALNRAVTDEELYKIDIFAIRTIGLTQSASIPETAKILCEGLDDVTEAFKKGQNKEIRAFATQHKMRSGEDFYRWSRKVRSGMAFKFMCGTNGFRDTVNGGTGGPMGLEYALRLYSNYFKQKQQQCRNYAATAISAAQPQPDQQEIDRSLKPAARF
jgi:hypothetical protein